MAITYHAGRRIQGTSTDFGTDGAGIPAVVTQGGWKELGRHTLSSAGDYLEVSGIADKKYYMIVWNTPDGTASWCQPSLRLGIGSVDTGTNYGERYWRDGVFGSAHMNTYNGLWSNLSSPNKSCFGVSYISNESDREKLIMNSSVDQTNPPSRLQSAGKWTDVSAPIDLVRLEHQATGNGFNTGSELVVLGWDPTDTHTTNFWEELVSVSASGSSTTLDTGTFTAKKFLWVQIYLEAVSNLTTQLFTYNSDSTNNYSQRSSRNGSEVTNVNIGHGNVNVTGGTNQKGLFYSGFIVNDSSNEKLAMYHGIGQDTVGAGTVPVRLENVHKWTRTSGSGTGDASSQITRLKIYQDNGVNFGTGSIIKVWGSN